MLRIILSAALALIGTSCLAGCINPVIHFHLYEKHHHAAPGEPAPKDVDPGEAVFQIEPPEEN